MHVHAVNRVPVFRQPRANRAFLGSFPISTLVAASPAGGHRHGGPVKAFIDAEAYPGPSLIIAYSHCIAHGYDMAFGLEHERLAADSGYWPLYHYDPQRVDRGESPLVLDSPPPKIDVSKLMASETRFQLTAQQDRDRYRDLVSKAQQQIQRRLALYQELAGRASGHS